jgi:hypothetical protein
MDSQIRSAPTAISPAIAMSSNGLHGLSVDDVSHEPSFASILRWSLHRWSVTFPAQPPNAHPCAIGSGWGYLLLNY